MGTRAPATKLSKMTKAARDAPAELPLEQRSDHVIRPVRASDLEKIIAVDAQITGIEKAEYWHARFKRYGARGRQPSYFLVAARNGDIDGFIIGEIRDWEFGTPPCGWVFGISVRPEARLSGIATRLLDSLCSSFRKAGMTKVRTLLVFDDLLVMKFYRSQGMMAAPIITLGRDLE